MVDFESEEKKLIKQHNDLATEIKEDEEKIAKKKELKTKILGALEFISIHKEKPDEKSTKKNQGK